MQIHFVLVETDLSSSGQSSYNRDNGWALPINLAKKYPSLDRSPDVKKTMNHTIN
jgi:hypothetical protein